MATFKHFPPEFVTTSNTSLCFFEMREVMLARLLIALIRREPLGKPPTEVFIHGGPIVEFEVRWTLRKYLM